MTRTSGSFLLPGLAATTPNFGAVFGVRDRLASVGLHADDDLVYEVGVPLRTEHSLGELHAALFLARGRIDGRADAVGRHRQGIFKARDQPADQDRQRQGDLLEPQVAIPGEGHEHVRSDQKTDCQDRRGNGGHRKLRYGWQSETAFVADSQGTLCEFAICRVAPANNLQIFHVLLCRTAA